MLSLSNQSRIFIHALPTDMRKSFDGLCGIVKRLEKGCFQRVPYDGQGLAIEVDATTLTLVLSGIDLSTAKRRKRFSADKPVSSTS